MNSLTPVFAGALALGLYASSPTLAADDTAEKKEAPVPDKPLEEQIIGYWAPDAEAMIEALKEELGDDPGATAFLPQIAAMFDAMAVQIEEDKLTIHAARAAQTATYTVTKVDPAGKTVTMKVVDQDGVSEGIAKVHGDKLTLSRNGEDFIMNRIDRKEFQQRKAASRRPFIVPDPE